MRALTSDPVKTRPSGGTVRFENGAVVVTRSKPKATGVTQANAGSEEIKTGRSRSPLINPNNTRHR